MAKPKKQIKNWKEKFENIWGWFAKGHAEFFMLIRLKWSCCLFLGKEIRAEEPKVGPDYSTEQEKGSAFPGVAENGIITSLYFSFLALWKAEIQFILSFRRRLFQFFNFFLNFFLQRQVLFSSHFPPLLTQELPGCSKSSNLDLFLIQMSKNWSVGVQK